MTEGVEAITTRALTLALDAASLRQQASAANIANAGNDWYSPVRVSFEAQLEEARFALQGQGRLDGTSLEGVRPEIVTAPLDPRGRAVPVALDAEVAEMARNAAHYQALVVALSRHLALLAAAVSDGKK
jgi:flagellar basal-body rod protein FlgB